MERELGPVPPQIRNKVNLTVRKALANLGRVPKAGGVDLALPEFQGDSCDNLI